VSEGDSLFAAVVGTIFGIWAWVKLIGVFKVWVFPWLYRFTSPAGLVLDAIYPHLHRMLYCAPYYRRELPVSDDLAGLLGYVTPLAVFALAWSIIYLYLALIGRAAEAASGDSPDWAAAAGWFAAVALLGILHAALIAVTPPLVIL
jgi:hypothetical protein